MTQNLLFGIGYKARSGKDTTADYIEKRLVAAGIPVIRLRFSAGVYDIADHIADTVGEPREKRPGLLQYIGMGMRDIFGPDVWVKAVERQIAATPPGTAIFITDLRFKNEFEMLRRAGFKMVKIHRENRPIDRDPNHPSEIDLDGVDFDVTINNDGSLEDLYAKIDQMMA